MEDDRSGDPPGAGISVYSQFYERNFDAVYDYAVRLSQDRDIAALVVQSSFLRVFRALSAGQNEAPELQLYTGAHADVAERLRARRGASEALEEPYAAIDPSRLQAPIDDIAELGLMVWSAAIDLKVNDYELLELNVRQCFETPEIGTILGQRPETIERRLTDAHGALERSLGGRLLFTRGRRECMDLDFSLGDSEWSAAAERRCWRHADGCTICRATITTFPRAADVLAALLHVPAPGGWRETMLERLQEAMQGQPAPAALLPPAIRPQPSPAQATPATPPAAAAPVRQQPVPRQQTPMSAYGAGVGGGGGFGEWIESLFGGGGPRGPILGALLGGMIAVVVVIAALCAVGSFGGDGDDEPEATVTATLTPTEEPSGTPTVTVTPSPTQTLVPQPIDTDTPVPTDTPPPANTDTPEPTDTPPPLNTNTPVPPTSPPAATLAP